MQAWNDLQLEQKALATRRKDTILIAHEKSSVQRCMTDSDPSTVTPGLSGTRGLALRT